MSGSEILKSVRYVVDEKGRRAAVQIEMEAWESLLKWIEDLEDQTSIKEALPRMRGGPQKGNALEWNEVKTEWDPSEPKPRQ